MRVVMWLWKTAGTRSAGTQRGRNTCVWGRVIRRRSLWTPEPSTSTAKVLNSLLLVRNLCATQAEVWIRWGLNSVTFLLLFCKRTCQHINVFYQKFTSCATTSLGVISLNCCINIQEAAWSWICLHSAVLCLGARQWWLVASSSLWW